MTAVTRSYSSSADGHRGAEERMFDVLVGEVAVLARVPARMDGVGIGLGRRGRPADLGVGEPVAANPFELVEHPLRRRLELGTVTGHHDLG